MWPRCVEVVRGKSSVRKTEGKKQVRLRLDQALQSIEYIVSCFFLPSQINFHVSALI